MYGGKLLNLAIRFDRRISNNEIMIAMSVTPAIIKMNVRCVNSISLLVVW